MKIHYLGTGAAEGWPGLFCSCENCRRARAAKGKNYRTRAQVLIDDRLLVDFGPDTYAHLQKYDLDFSGIQQVLITHSHSDHFYPADLEFRSRPFAYDRDQNRMVLYGNEKTQALFLRMKYSMEEPARFDACTGFERVTAFSWFSIPGYRILPLHARHDPKEECLLYLIQDAAGKTMLYGNDSGIFPEDTWEALKGQKLTCVSLDCTLGKDPNLEGGHMGLAADRAVVRRLREMGCIGDDTRIVLTHFSHNGGLLHEELVQETEKDGFQIAWDGMVLNI